MFKTHIVVALFIGVLLIELLNPIYPLLFLAVLCLAAAVPDIDAPQSKIGKKVGFFSKIISFTLGHRGVMHSLYFPAAFLLFSIFLGFPLIGYAFAMGYTIHLLTDMLTKDGVHLLYPFFHVKGFISTGGIWETVVFFAVISLLVLKISSYF
tara:strand:- start:371 stop:826 length:456 start_codon:yes stop_codon:yes gene_type:complete